MARTVTAYDLLISCPGDVSQFVEKIENAVSKFNNFYGRENDIVLRTISWTNNSFPQFGAHPQKLLDKQIVEKADIAIAVFWTRFGTETEDYGSGTEEEIEKMLKDGKQVFLYFLDKPIQPSKIDQEQYSKIQAFKEKHKKGGLFFTVQDENALENAFRGNLELYMDSIIHGKKFSQTKGSKLILWVDDCPENNIYLRHIFENYGLKFDLALSTDKALNQIENNDYALIISDMGRKEGPREGYVLLKQIRDNGNNVPYVIFSSDGSRSEHRFEAEKHGAQGSTDDSSEAVDLVLKLLLNK
ncbi:response regulator [Lachnoclostridium phytofermentans]|uniref:response regulator n=1 Tax=Lachnoclostridium phytofermentans TaxID=66219 RepID=UPI0009DFA273|nr:response regulator [Lachnoclostridium phytofermentans]